LNSTFLLKFDCRSSATARKLAAVLEADNRGVPIDQRLAMSVASRSVTITVGAARTGSGFTTVQSILRDVALFQEIWLISYAEVG
jgi:hypothetical protein